MVVTVDPLFELESLGYRYGNNCQEAEVPADSYVNYFEVAYRADDLTIKQVFANFALLKAPPTITSIPEDADVGETKNAFALFGESDPETDLTKGWFFKPEA